MNSAPHPAPLLPTPPHSANIGLAKIPLKSSSNDRFSARGDSSSLVVTENGRNAVGLVFCDAADVSLMIPVHW